MKVVACSDTGGVMARWERWRGGSGEARGVVVVEVVVVAAAVVDCRIQ